MIALAEPSTRIAAARRCRLSLFALLIGLAHCTSAFAADAPLTFKDKSPQRYTLSARASVIDPKAKAHPEIDFLLEKDGKLQDIENASVDTRVAPRGKLVI